LTPELAPELESADLVILLDAALDLEPGRVAAKRIFGETQMVSSHDLSPAQLTGLAEALSGLQRPVFQITGGVCQTGFGESLTPGGERCARRMAEEAVKLLAVADLNPRGVQALGNQA
jgi:Ni,Fe-hydrogenase maturation factor